MTRRKQTRALVINTGAAVETESETNVITADQLQAITFNIEHPNVRHEILEGRNYTVVPMVMLTEGVHEGSNGPLYYSAAELSKTPAVWNHKPIVVYHPTSNGEAISACEPAVISRRKVGLIMNTKYVPARRGKPGQLKAEAWLETNRLKQVDERVATAVQNRQMMEISTGLFTDNELVDGQFGKEPYTAIARNYRADHLAILPDEVGACSIKDGGGLMRNANHKRKVLMPTISDANVPKVINWLTSNSRSPFDEEDRDYLEGLDAPKLAALAVNAGIKKSAAGDTIDSDSDDNGETLEDAAAQIAPKKQGSKSGAAKNKAKPAPADDDEEEEDEQMSSSKGKGKPTENQAEPLTMEEYINNAPEGMRDVLINGVRALNSQKSKLIATITANDANVFSKQQLTAKSIQELQGIAALAAKPQAKQRAMTANYGGLGDTSFDQQVENTTAGAAEEEALVLPTINFARREQTE